MKKQIKNISTNSFFHKSLLIAALSIATGFQAQASKADTLAKKATIVYEGTNNNLLVFDIKFKNPDSAAFAVEMTDEHGNMLFQKSFTHPNFNHKIYVDKGPEDCKINFTIKSSKSTFNQTFALRTTEKIVEGIVITKL